MIDSNLTTKKVLNKTSNTQKYEQARVNSRYTKKALRLLILRNLMINFSGVQFVISLSISNIFLRYSWVIAEKFFWWNTKP
jgi:hypothetical protein